MSKLKPCPCCGSNARSSTESHRRTGSRGITFYKIYCSNRNCFVHCGPRSDQKEVRKSWNLRFTPEDETEAIKVLIGE